MILRTLFTFILLTGWIMSLHAQGLTGLQLNVGITAERHPVTAGPLTLQRTAEKNITFSVKNITNQTLTRALRLYMLPQPSGTPIIVWDEVVTFAPLQVINFSRFTSTRLGDVVTQNVGLYRLELRGSNLPDVNTVTTVSPLVPGVSGVNSINIRVISDQCSNSTVNLTQGIASTSYPTYIGQNNWLRNQQKNITFTLQNFSNNTVSGAFKLYLRPLPSGTPILVWEFLQTFAPRQSKQYSRSYNPPLGYTVTEPEGQYHLELRGSDIPDLNLVTPSCGLINGSMNPVLVTIYDCNNPITATISPPGPINLCPGASVTLTATANPLYRYQWRRNGVNIGGAINNTYTASVAGDYDVVVSKMGCTNTYITPVVKVNIYPVVATITGLSNSYTTLDPPVTMTGNPSGGTFSGPGVSGNVFNPQTAGSGTHTITYSGVDANGCSYSVSKTVIVVECTGGITIEPSGIINICQGDVVNFSASNLPGYSYQWFRDGNPIPGATMNTHSDNQAGIYTIRATKPGCPVLTSNTATIQFFPITVATITSLNNRYFDTDAPVTMTGTPPGGTFSGPGVSGNTFSPQTAGVGIHTITYSGIDANGCAYTTSVTVEVVPDPCNNANPVWWRGESAVLHYNFFDVLDINHDGKKDVLTCKENANPGKLNILFNNGNGFDPPVTLDVDRAINEKHASGWHGRGSTNHYADFDNDGNMDLMISFSDMAFCGYSSFRVYWGIATFPYFDQTLFTTIWTGASCTSGWGIDYDGDGDKDIFLESAMGTDEVFRNNGNRTFTFVTSTNHPRDTNYLIDDWNGDGKEDLFGANHGFNGGGWGIRYYRSNGDGTFAPPIVHYQAERVSIAYNIQADPLNNNQKDIMMNPHEGDARMLYIGTWDSGLNDFTFTVQNVLLPTSIILHAFDWNGDGFQDVISRQYGGTERLFVNYNDGYGNFTVREQIYQSTTAYPLFVDDLGNDCKHIFVKKLANDSIAILNARTNGIRYYRQTSVLTEKGDVHLQIYPNPARETVTISFYSETASLMKGQLCDITGRVIRSFEHLTTEGRNEIPLSVSDLPESIYLLKVIVEGREQVSKIIIR